MIKKTFLALVFFGILSLAVAIALDKNQNSYDVEKNKNDQVKLCLTMIVQNESAIIERCLNSVKDIVDYVSVSDNGSTDNTIEIIEQYLQKNHIPGKVHRHDWKDFGWNRTLAVQDAQNDAFENGYSLDNTYLLLMDADMVLKIESDFKKNSLQADSYRLTQRNREFSSVLPSLVKASLAWEHVGITHGYWTTKQDLREETLTSLWIDDRKDSSHKKDQFERDINLLFQGLQEEPDNGRYLFFLAQTHKDRKVYEEAIRWYKQALAKQLSPELNWLCKYNIGICYDKMSQWENARHWYLEAYEILKDRAEPLQKLANHYRMIRENSLAYKYAKLGSQIPYPQHHSLFIEHPAYEYLLDEEISISSYYIGLKEDGYNATSRLMLKKDLPSHMKESAYKNILFYLKNLELATFKAIPINPPLIKEGSSHHYVPMNTSIQTEDNGYILIVRTLNIINNKGFYTYLDENDKDKIIRTRNFLVRLDRDFKLISQAEIVENLPRTKIKSYPAEGFQDCRFLKHKNHYWMSCSTSDTHPLGHIQMSLCKLSEEQYGDQINVESLTPLKGPDPNRWEKNWLPFLLNNEIHLIYGYEPFLIYKPDIKTGDCETVLSYKPTHDFSRFRGSAGPIEFDKGYLLLVHEQVHTDRHYYFHRFLYLDKNFFITKASNPFTFKNLGIEYCCGMTMDHSKNNLVLSISIEDQQSWLCIIDMTKVRNLLEPL